jgi:hypothetical protein
MDPWINNQGHLDRRLDRQLLGRCHRRSILCGRLQWPLCNVVVPAESFGIALLARYACVRSLPSPLHCFIFCLNLTTSNYILILTIFTPR